VHEQARARAANLSLIEPDRVDHAFDHAIEVRVVEDDKRTLSAELEAQLLPRPSGRASDDPADLGRTGERDLVDVGMVDDRLPRFAVTGEDVEHPRRQPSLVRDLGEAERSERCKLGGLEDDRAAGRERWRDLPGEHQQREVPRDDLADDADALVLGELGVEQLCPSRVMVEVPRDERDVEIARLADRLPVVHALEHGEQSRVALYGSREPVEVARASVAPEPLPRRTRGARRRHRRIYVLRTPLRHAREALPVRRIDDVEQGLFARLGEPPTDVVTEGVVVLGKPGEGRFIALGGRAPVH
jgi:hypothetical protein